MSEPNIQLNDLGECIHKTTQEPNKYVDEDFKEWAFKNGWYLLRTDGGCRKWITPSGRIVGIFIGKNRIELPL